MLKELSKYENLGTPSYHYQLLKTFRDNPNEIWSISNISDIFHNRVIDGRNIFDGCLPILNLFGIIEIRSSDVIVVDEAFLRFLKSESLMIDKFVERLMITLNSDTIFHNIFCSEYISYDIIYRSIQIDNLAFPLKYSCFKQLLLDFNVLLDHPSKRFNKYIINGRYKKIFDKVVLPEIRKRKIGIEDLRKSLEQDQIYGEVAEKFVLKFERERLNWNKEVEWVAEYSTSDGYDIASFETEASEEPDRFIEVKSYNISPYFFWSRNEIDIARIKKMRYFLYLVDRDKMNAPGYGPVIIQNPYKNVLDNSDWLKQVEKYKITLNN